MRKKILKKENKVSSAHDKYTPNKTLHFIRVEKSSYNRHINV
jgi:hypothetical protein